MALAISARGRSRSTTIALEMRIGIGTGPVVAGVMGKKKFIYDLWGDTVNLASRMESHAQPGTIQVTERAYERLRHRYELRQRGMIEVKGKAPMTCYLLIGPRADPTVPADRDPQERGAFSHAQILDDKRATPAPAEIADSRPGSSFKLTPRPGEARTSCVLGDRAARAYSGWHNHGYMGRVALPTPRNPATHTSQ